MKYLTSSLRKLIPSSFKKQINESRNSLLKLRAQISFLFFPFKKKIFVALLGIFPRSLRLYDGLLEEFYKHRKKFSHPINEYKEFLVYFNNYFAIHPDSILKWRISVYFGHLIQQDFEGMNRMMKAHLQVQKKVTQKMQLDHIGFCISSDNLFKSYNVHAYLDTHIKAKILGMQPNKKITLLLKPDDVISNPVMLKYWKKYIDVITNKKAIECLTPLSEFLEEDLSFYADLNDVPVYIEHAKSIVQKEWEKAGHEPLLKLTEEDIDFGWQQLGKHEIKRDSWFVCLHVRDSGYKMGSHTLVEEYDSYRNANIENYTEAIKSIVERGGTVIRVGDPSMRDIAPMKGLFDYVHSDVRSNRMDIFLFSQCRFFVGVSSGPILNPILFGVPTIMTNFIPITGRPHASNCLYLPKLLWFNDQNRFATFHEILSSDLGRTFTTHGYTEKNIKILENSPEELNEVVVEMMDILDNKIQYSEIDNKLQENLNKLYRQYSGYGDLGRIGKSFIEKYSAKGLL